jgi:chromate transporter
MRGDAGSDGAALNRASLLEVCALFLKLGSIGFGGPPAHLAMMEEECVRKREWVDSEHYLEALAVCNLLPGPTSTQMALWLGYSRAGVRGGLLAGLMFLIPAFILLLGLSWAYMRYGVLSQAEGLLNGIRPVVIAILLSLCWRLSRSSLKDLLGYLLFGLAFALTIERMEVALVLLGAGILGWFFYRAPSAKSDKVLGLLSPLLIGFADPRVWQLTLFFVKIGALLFGGGLVALPLIQHEVVHDRGWMTDREFLDGVAMGQVTPGPVIMTACFIGYKVAGWAGAVMATFAIFLPSFLMVLIAAPQFQRVRKWPAAQAFLKGVSPAVVGAILAACSPLATALVQATPPAQGWFPASLFVGSLVALIRYKVGAPWVMLAGGLLGLLHTEFQRI